MKSVRIKSIYLKNFIGIQTGLGKRELSVSFDKFDDKSIILIVGENGTGKTTFMSVLHGLTDSTDGKRKRIIIEGCEGIKEVVYTRSDGCEFICKIVYIPNKNGGHNCKGFLTKINEHGERFSLNDNGNITSYKDVVFNELGLSESMLHLANQNDICKGHVDMTSTERKVNIASFLPDDIYSGYYQIVDKKFKELKLHVNILVESLSKIPNKDVLKDELEKTTAKINDLVGKRDKCTSKIAEFKTRIKIIKESGILDDERKLRKELTTSTETISDVENSLSRSYNKINKYIDRDSCIADIMSAINKISTTIASLTVENESIIKLIDENRNKRNSISDQIHTVELSISDFETNKSVSELEDLRNQYNDDIKVLSKNVKILPPNVTSVDVYITGYEIIKHIREEIESFYEYNSTIVKMLCEDNFIDFNKDELIAKKSKLIEEQSNLHSKISSVEGNSPDSTLSKRPHDCKIDTCPFISTAYRLSRIQENVPKYVNRLTEISAELSKIEDKLDKANQADIIIAKINNLFAYIKSNDITIKKLPKHEMYDTMHALKKCISNGVNSLNDCDDFDDYVEAVEDLNKLTTLITVTIPKIESDIALLRTNGKFIDSTKENLRQLNNEKFKINDTIQELSDKLEDNEKSISDLNDIKSVLETYFDAKSKLTDMTSRISVIKEKLSDIADKINELERYENKLSDKIERLAEIDNELNPLTKKRELYKTDLVRIEQFNDEKNAIEKDLRVCEIIRAALSVKDNGIPVSAMEWFMDSVRQNANVYLSKAFNGNLHLDEFIINSKDFIIPYHKGSEYGLDVSYASSSERSFISLCLTMAIIDEISSSYSIVCLDEIDKGFSTGSKNIFISILEHSCSLAGITQLFMITHNANFYGGYDNVGYIIFPGSDIIEDDDTCIMIEDC